MTGWKCPKHHRKLREVKDYPGALVCPTGARLCSTVFIVIDGHLCQDDGELSGWTDVKTGEVRNVSLS